MAQKVLQLIFIGLILYGCNSNKSKESTLSKTLGYPVQPVAIQNVKITDSFWLPIIKRVQEKTIAYAIANCEEE